MSYLDDEDENEFISPNDNLPETNQDKHNMLTPKKDYLPYNKVLRSHKYKTSNYLDLENL